MHVSCETWFHGIAMFLVIRILLEPSSISSYLMLQLSCHMGTIIVPLNGSSVSDVKQRIWWQTVCSVLVHMLAGALINMCEESPHGHEHQTAQANDMCQTRQYGKKDNIFKRFYDNERGMVKCVHATCGRHVSWTGFNCNLTAPYVDRCTNKVMAFFPLHLAWFWYSSPLCVRLKVCNVICWGKNGRGQRQSNNLYSMLFCMHEDSHMQELIKQWAGQIWG